MIDRQSIGQELGAPVLTIERGRLRSFARAIGETNPVYLDEAPAQALLREIRDAGRRGRGLQRQRQRARFRRALHPARP